MVMATNKIIVTLLFLMFAGNAYLLLTFTSKHNSFQEQNSDVVPTNENKSLKSISTLSLRQYQRREPSSSRNITGNDGVTSLLWIDMTSSQKEEAYSIIHPFLVSHTKLVNGRANNRKGRWQLPSYSYSCKAETIGKGWSGHHLCPELLEDLNTCQFFSFGIARAYSFEKDLADRFHCHGFASDPTTQYPSNIYKNVTFQQLGAQLLQPNMEQSSDQSNQPWWVANIPLLKKTLGVPHLNVLKMDCEGCEYALARDIIKDDPTFFDHVDQFAVEIHLAKEWLKDKETLYYYGILLKLLHDSGLRLHHTQRASCAPEHTKTGCIEDFLCESANRCHNYLFAKM